MLTVQNAVELNEAFKKDVLFHNVNGNLNIKSFSKQIRFTNFDYIFNSELDWFHLMTNFEYTVDSDP